MHFSSLLLGAGLAPLVLAGYTLQDDYSGDKFFDMFHFDTFDDPTHGYVNYVDRNTAQANNLISISRGRAIMRADSTRKASGRGRDSVRITSNKAYTHGLVVIDLQHMPASACGIWPAFWMTGPNWPNGGEIDILEGVNYQTQNAITMHTSAGCSLAGQNCEGNQGCGIRPNVDGTYGDSFNRATGGVYAMEWTSQAINIWHFRHGDPININVLNNEPDPSRWGSPLASFPGGQGCNIDDHFKEHQIVFDTTFCGDWAGGVWGQDPTCSSKAASCSDYVRDNPEAFRDAYWSVWSLKVFSKDGARKRSANETIAQETLKISPAIVEPEHESVASVPESEATASSSLIVSPEASISEDVVRSKDANTTAAELQAHVIVQRELERSSRVKRHLRHLKSTRTHHSS